MKSPSRELSLLHIFSCLLDSLMEVLEVSEVSEVWDLMDLMVTVPGTDPMAVGVVEVKEMVEDVEMEVEVVEGRLEV